MCAPLNGFSFLAGNIYDVRRSKNVSLNARTWTHARIVWRKLIVLSWNYTNILLDTSDSEYSFSKWIRISRVMLCHNVERTQTQFTGIRSVATRLICPVQLQTWMKSKTNSWLIKLCHMRRAFVCDMSRDVCVNCCWHSFHTSLRLHFDCVNMLL